MEKPQAQPSFIKRGPRFAAQNARKAADKLKRHQDRLKPETLEKDVAKKQLKDQEKRPLRKKTVGQEEVVQQFDSMENGLYRKPRKPRQKRMGLIPVVEKSPTDLLQERTVFISGIPKEGTTLYDVVDIFEEDFPEVVGVKILKSPKGKDGKFTGSAFVYFSTKEEAENFYFGNNSSLTFDFKKLSVILQKDIKPMREFTNIFTQGLKRNVLVKGFDREDTSLGKIKKFFKRFTGVTAVRKRLVRDRIDEPWTFSGSVFVTFADQSFAEKFMATSVIKYNDSELKRKWYKSPKIEPKEKKKKKKNKTLK